MSNTIKLLDKLKGMQQTSCTDDIEKSLKRIKEICDAHYSNQSFYGNAALNRRMLLDDKIAELLTPEVLKFIFTNQPTFETQIKRNSSRGGLINLKDAIYYGFNDGLHVIHMMPNNEHQYGPDAYEAQKQKFSVNTMKIVKNIYTAADDNNPIESEKKLNHDDLINKYELIVETINSLKKQGKSDKLLSVPGYTTDSMRAQVGSGFKSLLEAIKINDLNTETLDTFCEKFLNSPEAMLDGRVIHLFYDRAHILAAVEQDTEHEIGNKKYKFQDLFRAMITKIATNPEKYPVCAKEQFCLRFELVENDLQHRFGESYKEALTAQQDSALESPAKSENINSSAVDDSSAIDEILRNFKTKIESLGAHHPAAKDTANKLLDELTEYKKDAFNNLSSDSLNDFAQKSKTAIKNVAPILQRDLGWGDYLVNMAKQIINAITTLAASITSKGTSEHKGFFATKKSHATRITEELGNDLDDKINRLNR